MSGTRSTSRKAPVTEPVPPAPPPAPATPQRDRLRLGLILAPFVWGAVAINLFMLALIGRALGWPSLSPWAAMALAVPLTLPAGWLATRWIGGLLDEAEREPR